MLERKEPVGRVAAAANRPRRRAVPPPGAITCYRTAEDGAVMVTLAPEGVRVETFAPPRP